MKKKRAQRSLAANAVMFAVAVLLLSYSLVFSESKVVVYTAQSMLGNASSVMVGVAPNPHNTIAAQLDAKEEALDEREAALTDRERSLSIQSALPVASLIASIVLFLMIALNFYWDVRRSRRTLAT